jgi:hypothetical protein
MKLLYKPFAVLAAIIGQRLGKRAFKALWTEIDDSPAPPAPTVGESNLFKSIGGAALRAATIAATLTVVQRLTARAFRHLFGVWPDKSKTATERPEA